MNIHMTTLDERFPYTGAYFFNTKAKPFKLDSEKRLTLPSELVNIFRHRESARNISSRNPLVYICNALEKDVPYIYISDSPSQVNFDKTFPQNMDERNRLSAAKYIGDAGIKDQMVFRGCISHIRVYSRENWDRYFAKKDS